MGTAKKDAKKLKAVKATIALMDEQAKKLEEKKQAYTEAGSEAKQKGLTDQYNIALSGLRMTVAQLKRVYAVKLNFELALQTNDLLKISSEFLQGLQTLSEEMFRLTDKEAFEEAEKLFGDAQKNASLLFANTETYIDEFQTELKQHRNDD